MDTGHITPALAWLQVYIRAARTACAPGWGSRHGSEWISRSIASRSSQCHDGSSSTSSMRLP